MTPTSGVGGRTALVTGGGKGLGRAIASRLADEGARVVIAGRNLDDLKQTAELLKSVGSRIRVIRADVSDPGSIEALATELADAKVSILVNNAGVAGPVKSLTDVEPGEWDDVFAVNVRGTYLTCRAFLPAMLARGSGDVINIASVSGKRPLAGRTAYCASKMAVIGLSTTLAAEVGPGGIRVNTLSPGPVRGPRMERNFTAEAARTGTTYHDAHSAFVSRAALNRLVEEEEVANAVIAILNMPGMHGADIDLSAGMFA